jgi:putative oxidoreductase
MAFIMLKKWFNTPPGQAARGLDIVRIALALIYIVHPIDRIAQGPAVVAGFGEYLGSIGFPLGVAFAWLISLTQLAGSIALIFRRLVVPACIGNIIILIVGIPLIHAENGWFVVGGGRNGMEYSVMLIACFFAILWAYWPREKRSAKLPVMLVFILSGLSVKAGVNDISKNIPDTVVIENILTIVRRVQKGSPGTQIFVQSILPTNNTIKTEFPDHMNKDGHIIQVNVALARQAKATGFTFIDLYNKFTDKDGKFDARYTVDGLHPNAAGYKLWAAVLKSGKYL